MSDNHFEGPEKLLELWLSPNLTTTPKPSTPTGTPSGLRQIKAPEWQVMLNLVHCKILSSIHNEYCDSYLLSESSLFIFPQKLILKTCGTTTLLLAVEKILEMAKGIGLGVVGKV